MKTLTSSAPRLALIAMLMAAATTQACSQKDGSSTRLTESTGPQDIKDDSENSSSQAGRLELTSVIERPQGGGKVTTVLTLLPSGLATVAVEVESSATAPGGHSRTEVAQVLIAEQIFNATDVFTTSIPDLGTLPQDQVNSRTLKDGCDQDETISYTYSKDSSQGEGTAVEPLTVNFAKAKGCTESVLSGGNALQLKRAMDALLKLSRFQ